MNKGMDKKRSKERGRKKLIKNPNSILLTLIIGIFFELIFVLFLTPFSFKETTPPTGRAITNITLNTTLNVINWSSGICDFHLYPGWNLVSFFCFQKFSIENFTSIMNSSYESIFSYQDGKWIAYNPDLPSWVSQDLNELSSKYGYWIYMKEEHPFYFEGYFSWVNHIPLNIGWNLIGYPKNRSEEVNKTLTNISYNIIHKYDNQNKVMYYYVNSTNHTFVMMEPYHGYWLATNETQDLVIFW